MSLYEMHYVSNAAEQVRLKEQQQVIFKAFKELSVSSNLDQRNEYEKLLTKDKQRNGKSTKVDAWLQPTNYDLWIASECRPYSPYTDDGSFFETSSYASSITRSSGSTFTRQGTPSMVSSSSYISENATTRTYSLDENDSSTLPMTTVLSERDTLGFKRPVQWVKASKLHDFDQRYKVTQEKQTKSWNKLYMNNDQMWPSLCPELSCYVRKGIPQHMRAKVWLHYSGAEKKMNENKELYQQLLQEAEQNNENVSAIQKDLHRTFPDNTFFACDVQSKDGSVTIDADSNPKLQMLRRVLMAFSAHSPEIGYCQSLNFIAGFLLLFEDEEETFWMLVTIVHDYFPKNMFDKTMQGGNLEQTVLMSMIYERMPGVWAKIADNKCFWECEQQDSLPSVTLVTSHWFLTLFINILPVETVLRVWDCFFVGEGFKILYQVALTILKLNEQRVWDAKDSIESLQILQNTPKRMFDCDQFIKCVFSSKNDVVKDLNIEDIASKRDLFQSRKSQRILNEH